MRATLARHGRRFLHRSRAPSCALYATPARRRLIASPLTCRNFQRTFLNALFQKPPREVRQPEYEPGWMPIMVWRSRMLDNLRPQPRKELVEAWKKLMQSKLQNRLPLNSTQALQCRRLLEYLCSPSETTPNAKPLAAADLAMARAVLLDITPIERTQNHLDLARALHSVWSNGNYNGKPQAEERHWAFLVKSLACYGGAQEAADVLYSKWNDPSYFNFLVKDDKVLFAVAKGLAREGKEADLVALADYAGTHDIQYSADMQEAMVLYFAQKNKVEETKSWFTKKIDQNWSHVAVYRAIASFAARNQLQKWAVPIFRQLGESQPKRRHWDVLLQAMLLMGSHLSEVETMMGHMVSRQGDLSPTIHTVNGLLGVAVELSDAELASDIVMLATKHSLVPNGETNLILMRLWLDQGKLDEAKSAYEQAKYLEPWNNESNPDLFTEFRSLVNRYLVALNGQVPPDFALILATLDSVEEYGFRLEPQTTAALCLRFLENDQHFDVVDLLSVHSFLYSEGERQVVQNAFLKLCLDPSTSTSRAWNGYQLLHQLFQDTSFDRRVKLLDAFFARKRPDMAAQIFRHMRQHRNASYHPTMDTYIRCLEGFAQYPDAEGVESVHNMLKMDTKVQPNTKLYTALMLAYAACDKSLLALDFWNEITTSREGPSYASLEGVFWALERRPGGHAQAIQIWERIERMDLEIPPSVYNAYIGAIASSGNEKDVRALLLKMASVVGSEPDTTT